MKSALEIQIPRYNGLLSPTGGIEWRQLDKPTKFTLRRYEDHLQQQRAEDSNGPRPFCLLRLHAVLEVGPSLGCHRERPEI